MVANLVQIQDKLKDLSDNQLRTAYSQGTVPQFLVMTEMGRRKEMKEEYQKNQAQGSTTVAEDILSPAANMARGLGAMAQPQNRMSTQPQNLPIEQSMATMPPSPQPMANKLPVTRMADGGLAKIKAQNGISLDGLDGPTPFNRAPYFNNGVFNPEKFAETFYALDYPGSPRANFNPAATMQSPSFSAARAMDRLFPTMPIDKDYLARRRGRRQAVDSLKDYLRDPSAYREAILKAQADAKVTPSVVEQPPVVKRSPTQELMRDPNTIKFPSQAQPVPVSAGAAKPPAAKQPTVDIPSLLPKPQAIPVAGFSTNFTPFEDRLKTAVERRQPPVTYSSSLTSAEAAAKKALTDAQAKLTADSAYKDLSMALTDRKNAIGGQRDEAAGLALLEAAARIAGSKSPFITQAIGEAAPAIASYGKSLSEVRKQENALFDAEAKLTQLEVAETAGRKDEVSKLRGELRDLDKVRRDIDEKAFNRFEKTRNLEINVIKAEQQFAAARTTEARENARFRLSAAKDEREKNSLANQLGETQANITELEDLLRSGKSRGGQPLTDAERAAVQDRIGELKTRGKDIAGLVKSMKGDDLLTATRKQQLVKSYNAQIDSIKKTLGYGVDLYISQAKRKGLTEEAARKEFDNLRQQQGVMQREINRLLGLDIPSGAAPAGAPPNVSFKVKKPSS